MFLDIPELRVFYKIEMLDKTVFILWFQILEKMAEKWPLKTLKK